MFNKDRFSNLLRLALGNRSINKYGKDSGVDPGYISRYIRLQIEKAPSALILSKLAEGSEGRVSIESFMEVAGYLQVDPPEASDWLREIMEAPSYQQKALKEIWNVIRKM